MGSSAVPPERHTESCFVADEAEGALDLEHTVTASGATVTVCVETTRCVGTVDGDGFLVFAQQHIDQGTLAETLLLTLRARISTVEVGGVFGIVGAGGLLEVEVLLHRGTAREVSLGMLTGRYGVGSNDWQDIELDVDVRHVRFPADPYSSTPPLAELVPAENKITLVLTGFLAFPVAVEVDWITLKPKAAPGLAWHPVVGVHGLGASSAALRAGTAWADGMQMRDVGYHTGDLTPRGSIVGNGAELTGVIDAAKLRFGVELVHVLGHSKGALDAREHIKSHDDVETLFMLGPPNAGSFIADIFAKEAAVATSGAGEALLLLGGFLEMTWARMAIYNAFNGRNPNTTYVSIASDYDSSVALGFTALVGPSDEFVAVASAEALPYADAWTYLTSVGDPDNVGLCRSQSFIHHACLRYYRQFVDDLFPGYIAVLTPPPGGRAAGRAGRHAPEMPPRAGHDPAAGRRSARAAAAGGGTGGSRVVMSASGTAVEGTVAAYPTAVDEMASAAFVLLGDPGGLHLELVDPAGSRIHPDTTDPTVTYAAFPGAEALAYAVYLVDAPAAGEWSLEVSAAVPSGSDGTPFAVSAVASADAAVVLNARLDRETYAAGAAVTVLATVTEGGLAVTDAAVTAQSVHPDGTTTELVLLGGGDGGTAPDGVYTTVFDNVAPVGTHAITVIARRTDPVFSRQQVLLASVANSGTVLTGSAGDDGVDTDGDGRYELLTIEVGVVVDVSGRYRLRGTLTDGDGGDIEQVQTEQDLEPGTYTMALGFDGSRIFDLGRDGPYVLDGVVLEEVATGAGLDRLPPVATAGYSHTQFSRPPCLLTGQAADRGTHTDFLALMPYETLLVEVELDMVAGADVDVRAQLHAPDGSFVAVARTFTALPAGRSLLGLNFPAREIFTAGHSGSYTVRLLSLSGHTTEGSSPGAPVSLRAPGVVAQTSPYSLSDFAPSLMRTVGGTVTGLVGTGLVLRDFVQFVDVVPSSDGPFTFLLPRPDGSHYDVRVAAHPSGPVQRCTVTGGTGALSGDDVTDVSVTCATVEAPAALDPGFGMVTAEHPGATALALDDDGTILLTTSRALARFDAEGHPDPGFGEAGIATVTFGSTAFGTVTGLAVQQDGAILVAGHTTGLGLDFALARYHPDGTPDLGFGEDGVVLADFAGGTDQAVAVLVQSDGSIVAAGNAATGSPVPGHDFAVARFTPDGRPDPGFGNGGRVTTPVAGGADLAAAAVLQPDDKILIVGRVSEDAAGMDPDFGLVRYTASGAPDPDFGEGTGVVRTDFGLGQAWVEPADVTLDHDGRILVVGRAGADGPDVFAVARFHPDGVPDPEFGGTGLVTTAFSAGGATARAVAVEPDGTIVVAGYAGEGTMADFAVAKYHPDGSPNTGFGERGTLTVDFFGASDRAECLAVHNDGSTVVAGSTVNVTTSRLAMIRLLLP